MTWQQLLVSTARSAKLPRSMLAANVTYSRVPKKVVEQLLHHLFTGVTAAVLAGDTVTVPGFGTFYLKTHKARMVRNLNTGVPMKLPALYKVGFRASKKTKVTK